jgi:hypothetical protein
MELIDLSGRSEALERIEEASRVKSFRVPAPGELARRKASNYRDFRVDET